VKGGALLPSLRFHPAPGELPAGELQLPWSKAAAAGAEPAVIGQLARRLGAQVPGRLVASAKSWLSHAAVDRLAPILPWGAAADVPKVSPVEASASYLAYVRAAWNHRFPHSPLEQQDVVLTVPASFDEGARALTVKAAADAGLPRLRLLEEPQAAFYDWLFRHRRTLDAELAGTRLILVCDVGGGTTDLSLIKVDMHEGHPRLARIGVGKHLMLGGDNMDLVLAHLVEGRMKAADGNGETRLSASRLSQMIERCRAAKEQLLAADAPAAAMVTLLGSGAKLIGAARSVELTREEVERTIVDGFFPLVAPDEQPRQRRSGIVEFGLPYASDPAITRHLAGFLNQHAKAARDALGSAAPAAPALAVPDTLLLNGGVFRADALSNRLQAALAAWRGEPLRLLHNDNPDAAVARGAVAYALAREGKSPKIGGGSPRSYFLVLDDAATNESASRAVCILPRGAEQGGEILLEDRAFALRTGQPVRFHLIASTADSVPAPGELIDTTEGEFVRLPPIATVLRADAGTAAARQEIPVRLATSLTEVGTLEMHCVSMADASQRWLLEFQLRGSGARANEDEALESELPLPPRFGDAIEKIDRIFGARARQVDPKEVRQLRVQLEKLLGDRERWNTRVLRQLFDALMQRARARRRSADHERLWLNLAGFCLRPGFGYPLDDWRIEQLWPLFGSGVQYLNDAQACAEWWTMWRRAAGGLGREAQLRLLEDFAFNVQADEAEQKQRPATLVKGGFDDMVRVAASLERTPAEYKIEIGDWLFDQMDVAKPAQARNAPDQRLILWAIGRIGARQPFHGSAHDVVPPDAAARWIGRLLSLDWRRIEPAAFAAVHLARMTGDRSRDVSDELRERVLARLAAIGATPTWMAMVREQVRLDEASERRVLGDSLPPGLKLIA
ncbi:MAG: molecular chaperone DnaK, partial [Noviherbaspirillum sp.]|nr:molecular chaperone DnaK [Noviherbaspirillum sp.]